MPYLLLPPLLSRNGEGEYFPSATVCDRFEKDCNIQARSRRFATVCNTLQPENNQKADKRQVVEHNGLSDCQRFFTRNECAVSILRRGTNQRACQMIVRRPVIAAKKRVQKGVSEPLYVGASSIGATGGTGRRLWPQAVNAGVRR